MKNLNQPIIEKSSRIKLAEALKGITDDVMVLRQKFLRDEGLTKSGLFIMHFVSKEGPLNLTDCSMSLGVSKPTVTKIVDNLEKDGYVERRKGEGDRRSYFVHLTGKGRQKMHVLNARLRNVFYRALEDMELEEVEQLNASISQVREKLRYIAKGN